MNNDSYKILLLHLRIYFIHTLSFLSYMVSSITRMDGALRIMHCSLFVSSIILIVITCVSLVHFLHIAKITRNRLNWPVMRKAIWVNYNDHHLSIWSFLQAKITTKKWLLDDNSVNCLFLDQITFDFFFFYNK